jgi:hypothetical protein
MMMAQHLSSRSTVAAQIRMLGRLARHLDTDPRPIAESIEAFFRLNPEEREIFQRSYDGDDPVDTRPIR